MTAARNREVDCVLVWKFDRFARNTRHLLMALEEFDHLHLVVLGPLLRIGLTREIQRLLK